jgi:hypothetical protein
MVELDGVFCIKYKPRDSKDVEYGILVDEDKEFFYLAKGGYFNKKYYHYMRISIQEYIDATKNKREVPGDERNS